MRDIKSLRATRNLLVVIFAAFVIGMLLMVAGAYFA